MNISDNLRYLKNRLPESVNLVAVSKTKPITDLMQAYHAGQRIFGENKIQEMEAKSKQMPNDVQWHMIGHVQRNKVKYMASFVDLIHAVDSLRLLNEINKEAKKHNREINCLLQIKIAKEESKYGMDEQSAIELLSSEELKALHNVNIVGLMGMATFTDDKKQLSAEFQKLKDFFDICQKNYPLNVLSMGMSGDYEIAIAHGSNMVRIGSAIFGERN